MSLSAAAPLAAEDFRVETAIFLAEREEPINEYLTLFSQGFVYDLSLTRPEEMAVFDPERGRFHVLDGERRTRVSIELGRLGETIAAMKEEIARSRDRLKHDPEFEPDYDDGRRQLELSSRYIVYRATCWTPPEEHAAATRRYREFCDWQARLNALFPGNPPPFARLTLNAALADRGLMPQQVERIVKPQTVLGRERVMRSRHVVVWSLSTTDRKRISDISDALSQFTPVDWEEFSQARQAGGK